MARAKLGEILIRSGLLDQQGLERALDQQQRWGGLLGRYLVELRLISEETLVRALSTQFQLPAVSLDPSRMNPRIGRLVPKEISESYGLVCFRADPRQHTLDVAMSDPSKSSAIEEIRQKTQHKVRPFIASPTAIEQAICHIFYGKENPEAEFDPALTPIRPLPSHLLQESAGELPELEVEIAASGTEPAPAAAPPPPPLARASSSQAVRLPEPQLDDGLHITLDLPAVEKEALAQEQTDLTQRLATLEATLARNSSILQVMLDVLVKKGLISQKDLLRILQR